MARGRIVRRVAGCAAGIFSPFLSFLYPLACLSCNAPLERSAGPVCPACWRALGRVRREDAVYERELGYLTDGGICDGLIVPYYFEAGGPMQRLVHALKYNGMTGLGRMLGAHLAASVPGEVRADLSAALVPVPLHRSKLRERGYNQAVCIAMGMGGYLGFPVEGSVLRRHRCTLTQTQLDLDRRRANVAGAFQVVRPGVLQQVKAVLLVDDVITTGATVRACAEVLKAAGAEKVYACAAALAK